MLDKSLISRAIGLPVRLLPLPLQSAVVEPLLERSLRQRIQDRELDFLRGEVVEIVVVDIGLRWLLTLEEGRIRLRDRGRPAVTVTGGLREFLLLASRREDPDTLFFERRLTVEGDTELGLLVKNLLDSIELNELPAGLKHLILAGARLVTADVSTEAPGPWRMPPALRSVPEGKEAEGNG